MMNDFTFEITEKIQVLSQSKTGWSLELNKVSWAGKEAKYDVRSWSPDHKKMGKGITFSEDELKKLCEIVNNLKL